MKALALAVALGALATTAHAQDKATIQALETRMAQAANRQDTAAIAAMYAPDATLIGLDRKRYDGRAAIKSSWDGTLKTVKDLRLVTVEVIPVGPGLAVEDGTFSATTLGDKPQAVSGTYNMLWRKQGDDWVVVTDIAH